MTGILKSGVLKSVISPIMQFQRYRGKINIQRPRQPHYDRALVMAVTQPQYPKPQKNLKCFQKYNRTEIQNPYNDIIAREVLNWFNHSPMVAFFHLNSINADDFFDISVKLHRDNMKLKRYGKKIIIKATMGTRYETIIPLFESETCIVFSPHQKVDRLLKHVRNVPQMILLAGIIDNTLLNRHNFISYASLPPLPISQAQLNQTLSMTGSSLIQNLQANQMHIVNSLDFYVKNIRNSEENNLTKD